MRKLKYRYDVQLLIDGHDLDEDAIRDYIIEHMKGDCLLCVGDDELIKIHFHTNEPQLLFSYAGTLGEVSDTICEDMQDQMDTRGIIPDDVDLEDLELYDE